MSGSISAPMQGGGGAPMQGAGAMPPQLLQMLMQQQAYNQQQAQQNIPGQGPTAGGQGPAQAGAMPSPVARSQGLAMPGAQSPQGGPQMAQSLPQGALPGAANIPGATPGGMSNNYGDGGGSNPAMANMGKMMARMGRGGDSMMAHVSPGEIQVPPQVQTPQVLATLKEAFGQAGASPSQFVAGSPFASTNPATGNQEFSLWSAILPVVGAGLGSFIPGIGTAAGMALGGGLGGAAGGMIDHAGMAGTALGALGGGLGGYAGGGGFGNLLGGLLGSAPAAGAGAAGTTGSGLAGAPLGGATSAAPDAATAAAMAADNPSAGTGAMTTAGAGKMGTAAATSPSLWQTLKASMPAGLGAGLGQSVGQSIAPPNPTPVLNTQGGHMGPVNPQFGQMLGSGQSNVPTFQNYNPYSAVNGQAPYRFFPTTAPTTVNQQGQ